MGKRSRSRGQRGERELRDKIIDIFGLPTRRGTNLTGQQDIEGGIPGVHHEVKRVERLNIYKAMGQAMGDADEHLIPVVFHRKDRAPWMVTFQLDDIIRVADKVRSAVQLGDILKRDEQ
ncbi:MAG TPA: hypothetical protein DHW20_01730 [Gemmatimonadetes bacterium]|nr:hypothetical protein [Gemmatimonadota bacterium]|tara:strand:+ start:19928 stop:20284 length:357 start_codon:yes stop_codon:yes gene_type:complete